MISHTGMSKSSSLWKWGGTALLMVLMAALAIPSMIYLWHYATFPYPLEWREGASVLTAFDFRQGLNPYSLDLFPQHLYVYGFLYPLLIAPLLGLNSSGLLIARWVDVFFLGLCALTLFGMFRIRRASLPVSLVGSLIFLAAGCLTFKINASRPDIPALFFLLLSFYLVLRFEFNLPSLILCAVLSWIGFYFKQYMILPLLLVFPYVLFFVSKIRALYFLGLATLFGLVSVLGVSLLFPLYWQYSILHHINNLQMSQDLLVFQITAFLEWFWAISFFYLIYLLREVFLSRKSKIGPIRLVRSMPAPLVDGWKIDPVDFSILLILFVLIFSLGQHEGNTHIYFLELLLPFVLLAVIPAVERILVEDWQRLVAGLAFLSCLFPLSSQFATDFSSNRGAYEKLYGELNHCHSIYASPLLALYLHDRGLPVYETGQSNYGWSVLGPKAGSWTAAVWGGNSPALEAQWTDWQLGLVDGFRQQRFDCVVVDSNLLYMENYPLADYYHPSGKTYTVLDWQMVLWVPNDQTEK